MTCNTEDGRMILFIVFKVFMYSFFLLWEMFIFSDSIMKSTKRQPIGCWQTQRNVQKWPSFVVQVWAAWLTCWLTRLCSSIKISHFSPSALVSSFFCFQWNLKGFYFLNICPHWLNSGLWMLSSGMQDGLLLKILSFGSFSPNMLSFADVSTWSPTRDKCHICFTTDT